MCRTLYLHHEGVPHSFNDGDVGVLGGGSFSHSQYVCVGQRGGIGNYSSDISVPESNRVRALNLVDLDSFLGYCGVIAFLYPGPHRIVNTTCRGEQYQHLGAVVSDGIQGITDSAVSGAGMDLNLVRGDPTRRLPVDGNGSHYPYPMSPAHDVHLVIPFVEIRCVRVGKSDSVSQLVDHYGGGSRPAARIEVATVFRKRVRAFPIKIVPTTHCGSGLIIQYERTPASPF